MKHFKGYGFNKRTNLITRERPTTFERIIKKDIRMSPEEAEELQELADKYSKGNVNKLVMYSSLHYFRK